MKALADAGYPQAVIPPHERVPTCRFCASWALAAAMSRWWPGGAAGAGSAVGGEFGLGDVGGERGDCVSLRRFAGWPGASDGGESAG